MESATSKVLALTWWLLMSPASKVEGINKLSDEGGQQGCPLAALAFCLVIHPYILALVRKRLQPETPQPHNFLPATLHDRHFYARKSCKFSILS